jgi:hypothetical protein
VIFPGKGLVTTQLGAGEWAFLVVAAHMGLETTRSIEALAAALDLTDEVPLPASLAVCSPGAAVGEIDF